MGEAIKMKTSCSIKFNWKFIIWKQVGVKVQRALKNNNNNDKNVDLSGTELINQILKKESYRCKNQLV